MIFFRIICLLFLVLSVIFFPLWISLLLLMVFVIFLPNFWEGLIAVLFLDSLYKPPAFFVKFNLGFFTLIFIFLIVSNGYLKRLIQTNNFISKLVICLAGLFLLTILLLSFYV